MATDASGDWGCGAWVGEALFHHRWSEEQLQWSMPHKELFPLIRLCANMGDQLRGKLVVMATDSITNVFAINAGSSSSHLCNDLLMELADLERRFGFESVAVWLPREFNAVPDCLSKGVISGLPLCPVRRFTSRSAEARKISEFPSASSGSPPSGPSANGGAPDASVSESVRAHAH